MSKVLVTEEYLQDIADAIREKVGDSATYTPAQMGDAIRNIPSGGGGGFDPSDYTVYLESTGYSGGQAINTGYYIKDNTRFELVANVNSENPTYGTVFGVRKSAGDSPSTEQCVIFIKDSNASKSFCHWGTYPISVAPDMSVFYNQKCLYKLSMSEGSIDNGTRKASSPFVSSRSATNEYPLYLFTLGQAGSEYSDVSAVRCKMKLYSFKIYEDDMLVMDLVPFMDGSTPCLKDTVSGNMFYNAGAGSFTYGEDV